MGPGLGVLEGDWGGGPGLEPGSRNLLASEEAAITESLDSFIPEILLMVTIGSGGVFSSSRLFLNAPF